MLAMLSSASRGEGSPVFGQRENFFFSSLSHIITILWLVLPCLHFISPPFRPSRIFFADSLHYPITDIHIVAFVVLVIRIRAISVAVVIACPSHLLLFKTSLFTDRYRLLIVYLLLSSNSPATACAPILHGPNEL